MNSVLQQQLTQLKSSNVHLTLQGILHGIEKEGLRVTTSGKLSRKPHPDKLGSALTNGSVTTDFSESQLELITPVFHKAKTALNYLKNTHQFTYSHLEDELIWAGSMPCAINDSDTIPIAEFGTSNVGMMKHLYRVGLKNRYGSMMQSIAGIHYNFSLPEEFWKGYQPLKKNFESLEDFRSGSYFTLIRNFRRHSWILLYLFGASPALSDTFLAGKKHSLERLQKNTLYLPYATSLRMSDLGYSTNAQSSLNICFNQLDTYIKSLYGAIHTSYPAYEDIGVVVDGSYKQLATTILQIDNEYYSDIRPKRIAKNSETSLQALTNRGVEYIEVRNTDINPLLPLGMDVNQALFLDTFLITCLLMGDEILSPEECKHASENLKTVTTKGREPGLMLSTASGDISLEDAGDRLIKELLSTGEFLDNLHNTDTYSKSVMTQERKLHNPALTPSAQVLDALVDSGSEYHDWVLAKSFEHKQNLQESAVDHKLQQKLQQLAHDSREEQQLIEENDTLDFDEFLLTARTGEKETD